MYPVLTKAYEANSAADTVDNGAANLIVGGGAAFLAAAVLSVGIVALSQQQGNVTGARLSGACCKMFALAAHSVVDLAPTALSPLSVASRRKPQVQRVWSSSRRCQSTLLHLHRSCSSAVKTTVVRVRACNCHNLRRLSKLCRDSSLHPQFPVTQLNDCSKMIRRWQQA